MTDLNRTQIGAPPTVDPNRTVMGTAPTLNATQTIKPVQCPICKTFNPAGMMFCIECGLIFDRALPDDAFGAPVVRLPVLVEVGSGREHTIRPGTNVVGREGDVMIPDAKVSRRHAQVTSEDGGIFLEDLGSTNGTLLNGNRVDAGARLPVQAGDTVSFGGIEMKLSLPGAAGATQMLGGNKTAALAAPPTAPKEGTPDFEPAAYLVVGGQEYPLKFGINSFGRKAENDVAIADPYLSGRHGQIEVDETGIFFTDLGSTNGTFLSGAKLAPNMKTKIGEDDELTIGSLTLIFKRPLPTAP